MNSQSARYSSASASIILASLMVVPLLVLYFSSSASAEVTPVSGMMINTKPKLQIAEGEYKRINKSLKGWEYLAEKLLHDGADKERVTKVYANSSMPPFTPVYFSLAPKEGNDIYSGFRSSAKLKKLQSFINRYRRTFTAAEKELGVPHTVVGAILLVETHCGEVTGRNPLVYRLSRLASVGKPENLKANFLKLRATDPQVTFGALVERADYLERTFYPEVAALLKIAQMRQVNVFNIRGSQAGAFGIPQFLPTSYLRFGRDGNNDGVVSLFSSEDAIWSAANYLSKQGWDNSRSIDENRQILWKYNKSDAYIDTVIMIAKALDT